MFKIISSALYHLDTLFISLGKCSSHDFFLAFHFLSASGISGQTVGAVDINDLANKVYRHNFPETNLMQRSIEVCMCYQSHCEEHDENKLKLKK